MTAVAPNLPWRLRTAEAVLSVGEPSGRLVNQPQGTPLRYGGALAVQAFVIEDATFAGRLVLVLADIIWFSDDCARQLRRGIARLAGCSEAEVVLAASHSHGTPQPDRRFRLSDYDSDFERRVADQVSAVVGDALARPATAVQIGFGAERIEPPLAINRRRSAWHITRRRVTRRVQRLPNRAARCGNIASALRFRDEAGDVVAVLSHFACHPVSDPDGMLGPDYPGIMRDHLRAQLSDGAVVGFLQGFCGDIRPNHVGRPRTLKDHVLERIIGPRFRPSADGDSTRFGATLATAIARAIAAADDIADTSFRAVRAALPIEGA